MILIDPDGLYNGDRLGRCSDYARLLWPHLYLASNSYGRLELNFRRLRARIFPGYESPPTDEQLERLFYEYGRRWLIFFYEAHGQLWGAWDTPERCLPKYKSAADRRTPAPDAVKLHSWRKQRITAGLNDISENLQKFSANFRVAVAVAVAVAESSKDLNSSRQENPVEIVNNPILQAAQEKLLRKRQRHEARQMKHVLTPTPKPKAPRGVEVSGDVISKLRDTMR